jgi:phenylacetate-CoA ligase
MRRRRKLQGLYRVLPPGLQQAAISATGWRRYRERFGHHFSKALETLERNDRLSPDGVRADQERRLHQCVEWAGTTVPYYKNLFKENGIDPASIKTLEDLPRLPTLDRETVVANQHDLISTALPRFSISRTQTSGTTGTGLTVARNREALAWEYAAAWRQRRWFGAEPGDLFAAFGGQVVISPEQSHPPFWRFDRARSRMIFSLYHMNETNLAAYANEVSETKYVFWQGYPSSIALLCDYLLRHGLDLGTNRPRAIFTSSETLLDFHRTIIETATGAPTADRYGNTEISMSVVQCPAQNYHIDTEFGVIEIDPHQETEEWVRGEVIATGLANRAMPLLRYRTGDVATLLKHQTCPCGRSKPILKWIDGRIEDYVETGDGRLVGRMDHVFKDSPNIREAQILQVSPGHIRVKLALRGEFDVHDQKALESNFLMRLGADMKIDFESVDVIARGPNGKFRAVISEGQTESTDSATSFGTMEA